MFLQMNNLGRFQSCIFLGLKSNPLNLNLLWKGPGIYIFTYMTDWPICTLMLRVPYYYILFLLFMLLTPQWWKFWTIKESVFMTFSPTTVYFHYQHLQQVLLCQVYSNRRTHGHANLVHGPLRLRLSTGNERNLGALLDWHCWE